MISRTVTIPAKAERQTRQKIERVAIIPDVSVEVVISIIFPIETNNVIDALPLMFEGEEYEELMRGSPSWCPEKPEGVFRTEDLFAFIDYLGKIKL